MPGEWSEQELLKITEELANLAIRGKEDELRHAFQEGKRTYFKKYKYEGKNNHNHAVVVELFLLADESEKLDTNKLLVALSLVIRNERSNNDKECAKNTTAFMAGLTKNASFLEELNLLGRQHQKCYVLGSISNALTGNIDIERVRTAWRKGDLRTQETITDYILKDDNFELRKALWADDYFWKNARNGTSNHHQNVLDTMRAYCDDDPDGFLKSYLLTKHAMHPNIKEYLRLLHDLPILKKDEKSSIIFLSKCPSGFRSELAREGQFRNAPYLNRSIWKKAMQLQPFAKVFCKVFSDDDQVGYDKVYAWLEAMWSVSGGKLGLHDNPPNFDPQTATKLLNAVDTSNVASIFFPDGKNINRKELGNYTEHLMSSLGTDGVREHKDKILELVFRCKRNWLVKKYVGFIGWFSTSYRQDALINTANMFFGELRAVAPEIKSALLETNNNDGDFCHQVVDDDANSNSRGLFSCFLYSPSPDITEDIGHPQASPISQGSYRKTSSK